MTLPQCSYQPHPHDGGLVVWVVVPQETPPNGHASIIHGQLYPSEQAAHTQGIEGFPDPEYRPFLEVRPLYIQFWRALPVPVLAPEQLRRCQPDMLDEQMYEHGHGFLLTRLRALCREAQNHPVWLRKPQVRAGQPTWHQEFARVLHLEPNQVVSPHQACLHLEAVLNRQRIPTATAR